jgi:hypothetical protein
MKLSCLVVALAITPICGRAGDVTISTFEVGGRLNWTNAFPAGMSIPPGLFIAG